MLILYVFSSCSFVSDIAMISGVSFTVKIISFSAVKFFGELRILKVYVVYQKFSIPEYVFLNTNSPTRHAQSIVFIYPGIPGCLSMHVKILIDFEQ